MIVLELVHIQSARSNYLFKMLCAGTDNEERFDQDTNVPRATKEVPRITFVDESMLEVVAVCEATDLPEVFIQRMAIRKFA